jgi:hypothetical protein
MDPTEISLLIANILFTINLSVILELYLNMYLTHFEMQLKITLYTCTSLIYYPLANEVAKGYSNASVRPSFRNILVNTLESTSFNGF